MGLLYINVVRREHKFDSILFCQRKPQKSVLLPRWSLSLLATAEKAETQLAMKASASSIRATSSGGSSSVPYTIFS